VASQRLEGEMAWPPKVGESLPRAAEAVGVRRKLSTYSLDPAHRVGGPKARGFELILGITIRDIGYLEGAIQTGVLLVEISGVRDGAVGGINCVVDVPVRGRGEKSDRTIEVRTAWESTDAAAAPRLVTAYVRS
jgi:hypothetical protein